MLVEGPQLDRPARRFGFGRRHCGGKVFLYASCSLGPAALACRGRGHCRLNPIRRRGWRSNEVASKIAATAENPDPKPYTPSAA